MMLLNTSETFQLKIEKVNQGKGVPIEYHLCPLSKLENQTKFIAAKLMAKVDRNILTDVEAVFTEFDLAKQRLSGLKEIYREVLEVVDDKYLQEIKELEREMNKCEISFCDSVQQGLVELRSGEQSSTLVEALKELSKNDTLHSVQVLADLRQRELGEIFEMFLFYKKHGVTLLGKMANLSTIITVWDQSLTFK